MIKIEVKHMDKKPTCPKCGGTELTLEPVYMPNEDYWNPVICKACGTIVGQMPSRGEYEALEWIDKIPDIEQRLDDVKSLLLSMGGKS